MGGDRETLVNELTVIPKGNPFSPITVVIVTPVGKREHALLKSFGLQSNKSIIREKDEQRTDYRGLSIV